MTTTHTDIIIDLAEQQIREARREADRKKHIEALEAMQIYEFRDQEGEQWRTDELTTLLGEDLRQAIENSGCPRAGVISALMALFAPLDGLQVCAIAHDSYFTIEKVLSAEQWIAHSGGDADEDGGEEGEADDE